MKSFFQMILTVLAALALCTGCGTTPNPSSGDTTVGQADGGSSDVGGSADGWNDVNVNLSTQGYVIFTAKTPDNKSATFYVCNGYCGSNGEINPGTVPDKEVFFTYSDVTDIKTQTSAEDEAGKGQEFTIRALRPNYLFTDWHFNALGSKDKANATVYSHEWTDVGSWGLAPNKTDCLDSIDGKKKNVATSVKNGKVTLKVGTSDFEAWVTDHSIVATDGTKAGGIDLTGTISEDGNTINYHWIAGGQTGDATITCQ